MSWLIVLSSVQVNQDFMSKAMSKGAEIIDKITQFMAFANEQGQVKTYFNGSITQSQLIQYIVILLVMIILLRSIKSVAKVFISMALIVYLAISFGVLSPTKLQDTVKVVSENKDRIEKLAELSDNVKFDGKSAQIKASDGSWISTDDIKSFIKVDDDTVSINVAGQDIAICDKEVLELLEMFKDE